jgi:transcriptional regulator with XRE-family HTH domain
LGRQIKGLSLASALGCTRHAIWEWEAGMHVPGPKTLEKMARFFAQNDPELEQTLRDELFTLRSRAVEEAHGEGAALPPSRKGRRTPGRQTPRLANLDPALVRACGNLFGLDYGSVGEEVATRLGHRSADVGGTASQRNPGAAREVLVRYYADTLSPGRLAPYAIEVNGIRYELALATKRSWTGVNVPLAPIGETVPTEVCGVDGPLLRLRAIGDFRPRAFDFLCDIENKGLEIHDAPIFRLLRMGLRQGRLEAVFGVDSFLRFRFTIGLLGEELVDALSLACRGGSGAA